MKKTEIKLLCLEIVASLILILNIFVKNILNKYTIIVFLIGLFLVSLTISSFEKEKILEKKSVIKVILIYTLSFIILMYGIGLFTGYIRTLYSLRIISIIKNLFSVILLIIIEELFRYHICKKGGKKKLILVLSILLFVLIDVSLAINSYDLAIKDEIIKLVTALVFPSIFKNIMLTLVTNRYGYKECIIYQLLTNIYLYIMPIFPDLSIYLESIIMILLPLLVGLAIYFRFKGVTLPDFRNKHIIVKITTGIIIVITIIMIALYSNLFTYTVAVIGSGSMTPTLNVGDMIFIDKTYHKKLDKLEKGQILVFKIKNTIYTHRIVEIDKKNDKYSITTKGDRKGQNIDSWKVTNDDVVGVVKAKINRLGYPSVWLKRLVED